MATFSYNFTIKLETFSHRKASQNTECETWDHRTYYAVSLSGLLKIAFLQGNPCFHPHFPSCHSVLSSRGAFVFMGRPLPWDWKPSSFTGTSSVFALTPGAQFPFFLSFCWDIYGSNRVKQMYSRLKCLRGFRCVRRVTSDLRRSSSRIHLGWAMPMFIHSFNKYVWPACCV